MMTPLPHERVQLFCRDGYFVVPRFLLGAELDELRHPCDLALARARAHSKEKGHSTPSIDLLAAADDPALDPAVLQRLLYFVSSPRVCALLLGLAYPGEDEVPRARKLDYYHEQTRRDWDGDWHRDSQFVAHDPEHERAVISNTTSAHVRVALQDDDRLELVPGSHRRWDTQAELRVRKGAARTTPDMPAATRIVLRAGDACVFHAWSIHRGTYQRTPVRRTLDCTYAFGRVGPASRFRAPG